MCETQANSGHVNLSKVPALHPVQYVKLSRVPALHPVQHCCPLPQPAVSDLQPRHRQAPQHNDPIGLPSAVLSFSVYGF